MKTAGTLAGRNLSDIVHFKAKEVGKPRKRGKADDSTFTDMTWENGQKLPKTVLDIEFIHIMYFY